MRSYLRAAVCAAWATSLAAQTTFPTRVTTDFGGLRDDPAEEMTSVSSLYRLTGGHFLVANQKPLEVRLYDATGKVLRRYGRAGSGPGEFRSGSLVQPWPGDSVLTLTTGSQRWMLFETGGRLAREWPMDSLHPSPSGMRLSGWAYQDTGTIGSRGCITPGIEKIPLPSPWTAQQTVTDPAGRIWVRTGATLWRIYSPAGSPLGTAILPAGLRIHQFSGNDVIGQRLDEEDAIHVVVVEVRLPVAPQAAAPCAVPLVASETIRKLRTTVGNIRVAGEAWRSDAKEYPKVIPPQYVVIPEEFEATVLLAAKESWAVLIREKKGMAKCLFSIGPRGLQGWNEGFIACSEK